MRTFGLFLLLLELGFRLRIRLRIRASIRAYDDFYAYDDIFSFFWIPSRFLVGGGLHFIYAYLPMGSGFCGR